MKSIEKIFTPDERSTGFGNDHVSIHSQLSQLKLHESAPSNVLELFETAKHLSLYAVFVYEFNPVAELLGFQALEQAVRIRATREGLNANRLVFRKLMNEAVDRNWIVEEQMANRRGIARSRLEHKKVLEDLEKQLVDAGPPHPIEPPTDFEIEVEMRGMRIVETVCNAAVSLRNGLAHGNSCLTPHSHRRLEVTAGLINQLFPANSGES